MSFYTAVFDFAQTIGPPIFGVLADAAGYPAMFLAVAGGVALASAMWVPSTLGRRPRR